VSLRLENVLRLHRLLTQNTLPKEHSGAWKTRPNRVIDSRGVTVFTPPGPAQAKPFTEELLEWLQSAKGRELHPVLASAIAHHRLVSIHPFLDGNGRAARALAVWVLWARG